MLQTHRSLFLCALLLPACTSWKPMSRNQVFSIAGDASRPKATGEAPPEDARIRLNKDTKEPIVTTVGALHFEDPVLVVHEPGATTPALRLRPYDVTSAEVEVTSAGKTVVVVVIAVGVLSAIALLALGSLSFDLNLGGGGGGGSPWSG